MRVGVRIKGRGRSNQEGRMTRTKSTRLYNAIDEDYPTLFFIGLAKNSSDNIWRVSLDNSHCNRMGLPVVFPPKTTGRPMRGIFHSTPFLLACIFVPLFPGGHFYGFHPKGYWWRSVARPHPGRDQSGPYALGIASLAVLGHFATSLLKDRESAIYCH